MAVTKILKMNFLEKTLNYCMQDKKIQNDFFIHTHNCSKTTAVEDFEMVHFEKQSMTDRKLKRKQFMIIQSFKPHETTPEQAFYIGKKLAKKYLKNQHQYILTTHSDKEHIHNHIVFNAVNYHDFKTFNTQGTQHIYSLRSISDELCKENKLSVIANPQANNISQKEYYARKFQRSFKYKIEQIIDEIIPKVNSYEQFIEFLSHQLEVKNGKYLSVRHPDSKRFTRLKSLGIDYRKNSIIFRINNPDIQINSQESFKELIDKSQFKGRKGLERWATRQNIKTLTNIAVELSKKETTKEEYVSSSFQLLEMMKKCEDQLNNIDIRIEDIKDYNHFKTIYSNSRSMMIKFKSLKTTEERKEFKRINYKKFKDYDKAKKFLTRNKKLPENKIILDSMATTDKLHQLTKKRNELYRHYQNLKKSLYNRQHATKGILSLSKDKNIKR